jgi:beta-lactamase superfamily II metal-dependent hydrolase
MNMVHIVSTVSVFTVKRIPCSSLNCIIFIALINRYGHPHDELLARLKDIGSDIKITYESGAITMKTDGKQLRIYEYLKEK